MNDSSATDRARSIVAAAGLSVFLGACAASDGQQHGVREQAPIDSADMRGNYQQIAGCAYAKFTDGTSNVMQRNEFPERKQTRLALVGSSKYWELIFTQASPGITHVELTALQTIWGPDKLTTKNVMTDLSSCGAWVTQ